LKPLHERDAREVAAEAEQTVALPPLDAGPHSGFLSVVVRLTSLNAVVILAGLVTGPVTARALGPDGRGELAAILVVLGLAPVVLALGVSVWVGRERARGASREDVLGAALPVALACSLLGVLGAIPLSNLLGEDRPIVVTFLQIGLFLLPLSVSLHVVVGLAIGESRWDLFTASRVAGSVLPTVAIVLLALADHLSVTTAAAAYLAGGLLGSLMLLRLVKGVRRLSLSLSRSRAATAFGAKSWLSTTGNAANYRLDQVLMAGLVTSEELGVYAVAVTVGSLTSSLVGAVSSALFPRVAQGDADLATRSCRITVGVVAITGMLLAIAAPAAVPFVFGADFTDAVSMVLILLAASVPMAAAGVLSSALQAADDPDAAMRAELVALALTVPALILILPAYGGVGAAIVSLLAYGVRSFVQLGPASRAFGVRSRDFVLPKRDDLTWIKQRVLRRGGIAAKSP